MNQLWSWKLALYRSYPCPQAHLVGEQPGAKQLQEEMLHYVKQGFQPLTLRFSLCYIYLLEFLHCLNSHNDRVLHYRIWQSQSGEFYIDDNVHFQSLEEMIEFYKKSQAGSFYDLYYVLQMWIFHDMYSVSYNRTLYQIVWIHTRKPNSPVFTYW